MKTKFYWHMHPDTIVAPLLVEPSLEPIGRWRKYIRNHKPRGEADMHLKLLKPVKGQLPHNLTVAGVVYIKAYERYIGAMKAYATTWKRLNKLHKQYLTEIEKLHGQECPNCPWDGRGISANEGK